MDYVLTIRSLTVDIDTGEVLETKDTPAGTATLESVHGWLSSADGRIWKAGTPGKDVRSA